MAQNWKTYGASVAGKGHIEKNLPCQDAHIYRRINKRWIAAITSDGAGSHINSQIGSKFTVNEIIHQLKTNVIGNKAFYKNAVITKKEWKSIAKKMLYNAANELRDYSKSISVEYKSLSCTVNVALISEDLILTANIGDGRACYRNQNGEWNPMMIPFKGSEAGSTVFITTDWIWKNDSYIGFQMIKDKPTAFALISDGLEMHSYLCYTKDENGVYYDPNQPYDAFFETNVNTLKKLQGKGMGKKRIQAALANYLKTGNKLDKELDDKTLLVGFQNN